MPSVASRLDVDSGVCLAEESVSEPEPEERELPLSLAVLRMTQDNSLEGDLSQKLRRVEGFLDQLLRRHPVKDLALNPRGLGRRVGGAEDVVKPAA